MLEIRQRDEGGTQVIELDGEAGSAEAWEVGAVVSKLIESRPSRILLDFSRLTFISSLALGELMRLANDMARFNCRVAVAGMLPKIHEVLQVLRIEQYYEIYDNRDAALQALKS
jgi:anti-anti-sigma factor